MTPTERVREEFNSDCILVLGDCIRVYWYADSHGKWFPYDGGPLKGYTAPRAAERLAVRIAKYRDLLPKECRELMIELGELNPNGKFTLKRRFKECPLRLVYGEKHAK